MSLNTSLSTGQWSELALKIRFCMPQACDSQCLENVIPDDTRDFFAFSIFAAMKYITFAAFLLFCIGCQESTDVQSRIFDTADLNDANRRMLEVAMEDGFPPPVASRVYVYPHIAHYVTLQRFYPDSLPDISGDLTELTPLGDIPMEGANAELAALLAFCKTAKKVVFSEHYMDDLAEKQREHAKAGGLGQSAIDASDRVADQVAAHIGAWLAKDQYTETRTMDRWTSTKQPGTWIETPPDYTPGLEPHWMKIRPMVIDSANVFPVKPPPLYDPNKDSDFYNMVLRVYDESMQSTDEKKEIALFWDDNPNVTEHRGHMVVQIHKISPPGHWLNIIHQVSEREGSDLFKTTKAYTFTAIAMFDAIISCWNTKYSTDLVRPITYIQQYIDINWVPIIQTPPFPEYTSGHSAVSAAAASALTDVYGENYAFVDSTNVLFDQPVRTFESFHEAAWEVSLSRFYGGIHYYEAIEEGNREGKYIAKIVLDALKEDS